MKSLRQLINQSVHFKLKPVSVMIFTLFAQQAYAEALTLAQAEAQSKTLKQCIESVPNSRAKAMCKQNEQLHAQFALDEAFDKDIAASEKSAQTQSRLKLADASDAYSAREGRAIQVSAETIRTAAATDANPQGTSDAAKAHAKSLSKGKGSNNLPIAIQLKETKVRAKRHYEIGPMPGLALTKEEIPGNVQSITAKEIKESHALSLTELMNSHLQSVNVNDYQSNPFHEQQTA